MADFSKSQIDRLGERLKNAPIFEQDLRLLDEYRRSFSGAYETVVDALRVDLDLNVTGRPAKSTTSIVAKLLRESIRLTQIQDIAGCRTVVSNVAEQDSVTANLMTVFPNATLVDRRARPSHGYRAIHVIPRISGKAVEIQVRTELQHQWAELSERLSDYLGTDLKYGSGPAETQAALIGFSQAVRDVEELEVKPGLRASTELEPVREALRDLFARLNVGFERRTE